MPRPRMIVVAGPPGSGKTRYFPVSAFGMDSFNIDDRRADPRQLPRHPPATCVARSRASASSSWTLRNRVHLHAVVSGRELSEHRRVRWQHRWEGIDRACGMARVFPAKGRASAYLAKYCGKGGIVVVRGRFAGWPAPHDA